MLLNDVTRNDKMNGVHTRDLQNAVVRHHKNNPHVSREAAFEYIMSISSTYRALPDACIEKARRYLALPKTCVVEQKPVLDGHTPLNGQQTVDYLVGLTNDLVSLHPAQTPGYSFNIACGKLSKLKTLHNADVIEASKILGLSLILIEALDEPKPSTTVVHAERVVVDDEKMIKILKFENVEHAHNLPNKYTDESPHFYVRTMGLKHGIWLNLLINNDAFSFDVMPGDKMYVADFNRRISAMKEAAARLAKINKTAKLEREHSGKFTVSI